MQNFLEHCEEVSTEAQGEDAGQRVEEAWEALDKAKEENLCKVCRESEADTAFIECGHVLCASCAPNMRSRCPFCRRYTDFIRLYRA